ncbi:exostosin domain-containing protein [Rhodoplanes sp. Z2-YC6860]|uniref:exostosin domain-containing protein n=1 Tax=Rhodoplanes sp. Z2-YC6860 TaxID=674703 RepID=UPI00078E1CEB|nr:exostosin family protein [Rhodoplanes sp. Z2-YC6860]AMN43736.1 Exostosin family protein [Rhodoplanes sp. Z2-YC6860]
MKKKFFITAFSDNNNSTLVRGNEILEKFPTQCFIRTREIQEADIVLYLEHGYFGLSELPFLINQVRRFPVQQHFVYSESDWPYPILPGAYASLSRRCDWAHSWSYLPSLKAPLKSKDKLRPVPRYLFSFLGRINTHPLRQMVRELNDNTTPCIDVSEAPQRIASFDYTRSYFDLIQESKFVLCPRGFGPSSIRIYEAMSCGRVPVIISDKWLPPPGIDWDSCSVMVREKEIASIPVLLGNLKNRADEMGQCASRAYSRLFGPDVFFDQLLLSVSDRYLGCSSGAKGVLKRALRALDGRAVWTLLHQTQARVAAVVQDN